MMKKYKIDCIKFYGQVTVDENNIITDTIPIIQIFIGQPLSDLIKWVETNFKYCTLKEITNG